MANQILNGFAYTISNNTLAKIRIGGQRADVLAPYQSNPQARSGQQSATLLSGSPPPETAHRRVFQQYVSVLSSAATTQAQLANAFGQVFSRVSGPDPLPYQYFNARIDCLQLTPPPPAVVGQTFVQVLHRPYPNRVFYWDGVVEVELDDFIWDGDLLWVPDWTPNT